jgi:hypothetical protein
MAKYIAKFKNKAAIPFLTNLLKQAEIKTQCSIKGALIASGDKKISEDVLSDLKGKSITKTVEAILIIRDTYDKEQLKNLLPLLEDNRDIKNYIESCFEINVKTKAPGRISSGSVRIQLKTIGEVAIEAANCLFRTTTPKEIAWWYEREGEETIEEKTEPDGTIIRKTRAKMQWGTGKEAINKIREYCKSK